MAKKTPSFDVLKVTFLHVLSLLQKEFSYLIICKGEFSSFWILQQWSRPENLLDTEDLLINKPVLEQMDFFPSFSAFYRFAMNFQVEEEEPTFRLELSCHYSKIQVCLYGVTLMDRAESCWFILPLCYLNETWPKLCYFSCILCLGFFCTNKVGEAGLLKVFATKLWLSSGSICERVGFSDLIDLKGESVMPDIW